MVDKDIIKDSKEKILNELVHKSCWAVLAGQPSGGIIHLHIGEKIQRKKIINNPHLPEGLQEFSGEYRLSIQCDWRLQKEGKPVTGSCEPNYKNGPLKSGLKQILNREISSVTVTDPCGDLEVHFDDLKLKIFCNFTGNHDVNYCFQDESNWYLFKKKRKIIDVTRGCCIKINE